MAALNKSRSDDSMELCPAGTWNQFAFEEFQQCAANGCPGCDMLLRAIEEVQPGWANSQDAGKMIRIEWGWPPGLYVTLETAIDDGKPDKRTETHWNVEGIDDLQLSPFPARSPDLFSTQDCTPIAPGAIFGCGKYEQPYRSYFLERQGESQVHGYFTLVCSCTGMQMLAPQDQSCYVLRCRTDKY